MLLLVCVAYLCKETFRIFIATPIKLCFAHAYYTNDKEGPCEQDQNTHATESINYSEIISTGKPIKYDSSNYVYGFTMMHNTYPPIKSFNTSIEATDLGITKEQFNFNSSLPVEVSGNNRSNKSSEMDLVTGKYKMMVQNLAVLCMILLIWAILL